MSCIDFKKMRSDWARQYRLLLRMKLNYINRKNLLNRDFSIICSNCVGGVISHDLGLQFKSPTVDLFLYPDDYLKFIYHLKYYLSVLDMHEDREMTEKLGYPVGILDDIKLYFGHYSDFKSARDKWYERSQRVNFDNLYFMMIERDGCTEENLRKFDEFPASHKVVFTKSVRTDLKSSYYIPGSVVNHHVMDLVGYKNRVTGRRWIDDFDYVKFLNEN